MRSPPPDVSVSVRQLMADVGPRWRKDVTGHVKLMVETFSEILGAAPTDGATVHEDLPYGEHERHRLDVFVPHGRQEPLPAVLFVHGGAFVSGHRNRTKQIYSNVLHYFARHGIAGVNIGYRLAGDAVYPGATLDITAAAQWVRDHAEAYDIDRNRLFLMAHSAGAAHAGTYAYDSRFRSAADEPLDGLVVGSGGVWGGRT